jgi:6-phosphogluconolactonase (cycloisomerase 2 family)
MRRGIGIFALAAAAASVAAGLALAGGGDVGKLKFANAKFDNTGGVDGIDAPDDVALSPDGHHLYVTGFGDDAVATFERRRRSSRLSFVNAKFDGQGGVSGLDEPEDLTVSPDGENVYVAAFGGDSVVMFSRNENNGRLQFVGKRVDGVNGVDGIAGAQGIVVSPDGHHVYVTSDDNAIATFRRKSNGKLDFINAKFDGTNGIDGLGSAWGVVVSPDGDNVYVASDSDDAVVSFKRRGNGRLSFLNAKFDNVGDTQLLDGVVAVDISRDGRHVYVAAYGDSAVTVFKPKHSGRLKFIEDEVEGEGGVENLSGAYDVVLSRDGRSAYVPGYNDDAIVTFRRSDQNGKLSFVNAKVDGQGEIDGLAGVWRLAADNRGVFGAGFDEDAVSAFKRRR